MCPSSSSVCQSVNTPLNSTRPQRLGVFGTSLLHRRVVQKSDVNTAASALHTRPSACKTNTNTDAAVVTKQLIRHSHAVATDASFSRSHLLGPVEQIRLRVFRGKRICALVAIGGSRPSPARRGSAFLPSQQTLPPARFCAGSGSVAVQQNGPGASGGRLEGHPRAHHVLLQEGAVQLRGVRLPDPDGGVHPQSERTCFCFPDLMRRLGLREKL